MPLRPVYNIWDLESASFGCGFWTTLNVVSISARAIYPWAACHPHEADTAGRGKPTVLLFLRVFIYDFRLLADATEHIESS